MESIVIVKYELVFMNGMVLLPNIAGAVAGSQVFAVGADADASDSVAAVVTRVTLIGRTAGRQILILQERQIRIDV